MKSTNFGETPQSSHRIGMVVRIGLASFALLGSLILAWTLLSSQKHVHADANITRATTTQTPWGLALDTKNGHIWVAEPGCDASPTCTNPTAGGIGEYNLSNDSKIQDFTPPSGKNYSPVFLKLDGSGNVWFTDPTNNAIGELVVNSNTWTEFPVTTTNAAPYDLVFDSNGNIWFTEIKGNQIGFYNVQTQKLGAETAPPTASSHPYGITVAPNKDIWFTENGLKSIASFTPTADGTLAANAITEHAIGNADPHLITADKQGNIWYSEGFSGSIGEFTTADSKDHQFNVAQGACPQTPGTTPSTTPTPSCGVHISGIGVDSNNKVWFDDSLSQRVGFFDPSASGFTAFSIVTSNDTNPHPHDGLVVDNNNNVWVSEEFGNNLDEIAAGSLTATPTATTSASPTATNPPPSPTATTPTASPTATNPPPSPTATNPPTTPPGPVAKTWYFAEGRIGKGFRQYLTIANPGTTDCSVDIKYLYTPENGAAGTKTVTNVTIAAGSRLTESVNQDFGIYDSTPTFDSLASIVTMNSASTCPGVMAERPLYFSNYHGISSGNDVSGATRLGTSYYFADVPTGPNNTSYLSILNPPGQPTATVTVNYYLNGQNIGSQSTSVPEGSRGTIAPNALVPALPAHVAAVVTSTVQVFVERPTYFTNGSNSTSGGYDVVGAQTPTNDWLFAEGYASTTGNITQEYLTLANLDATNAADVTITLKSQGGSIANYSVTVNADDQLIWDVNAHDTFAGATKEVPAEVKSTRANIVVQREMYFQYHHSIQGGTTVQTKGGTDVMGMVGPISKSAYSFAEGYTNTGYHTWLTLQNPNATAETITVTLVNGHGQSYMQNVPVPATSRQTVDVTQMVEQHLAQPGTSQSSKDANSISMTVQTLNNGGTFVAERPEYWNTSGSGFVTQGGSDIIGYDGN